MSQPISSLMRGCRAVYPGRSPRAAWRRFGLIRAAIRHRSATRRLLGGEPGSSLHTLLEERPEMLGVLVWPFICASWPVERRVEVIAGHCAVMDGADYLLRFSIGDKLSVIGLTDLHDGLRIILDRPRWFMREGQLVLNLFVGEFRAYSIAFSLHDEPGVGRVMYVGSIQGRNVPHALDLYRGLTKALFGVRPRDFVIELARVFGRALGTERMLCVSDAQRHHRHPYFSGKPVTGNYDEIWEQRGGIRYDADFFELPLGQARRDFETINPKKRSMYRQRFELLDRIEAELPAGLRAGALERFDAT
jgi:uncharacterized protein VirK/YbjX